MSETPGSSVGDEVSRADALFNPEYSGQIVITARHQFLIHGYDAGHRLCDLWGTCRPISLHAKAKQAHAVSSYQYEDESIAAHGRLSNEWTPHRRKSRLVTRGHRGPRLVGTDPVRENFDEPTARYHATLGLERADGVAGPPVACCGAIAQRERTAGSCRLIAGARVIEGMRLGGDIFVSSSSDEPGCLARKRAHGFIHRAGGSGRCHGLRCS